jgi:hypothetical protein
MLYSSEQTEQSNHNAMLSEMLDVNFVYCLVFSKCTVLALANNPKFKIFKIRRSPSSPYFPIKVSEFSNDGVSMVENQTSQNYFLIFDDILTFATSVGENLLFL